MIVSSTATVVFVIAIVVLHCWCCCCFQFEALSKYASNTQEDAKTRKSMGWVRVGGCYAERRTNTLRSMALAGTYVSKQTFRAPWILFSWNILSRWLLFVRACPASGLPRAADKITKWHGRRSVALVFSLEIKTQRKRTHIRDAPNAKLRNNCFYFWMTDMMWFA